MYQWREAASTEAATLDFSAAYASSGPPGGFPAVDDGDNDFDDFEEDEMTKRIREEEERIQNRLREKSVRMGRFRSRSGRISRSASNRAGRTTNGS